jgi:DNA-directed RNA polymerase subunit RPC12/RpoP
MDERSYNEYVPSNPSPPTRLGLIAMAMVLILGILGIIVYAGFSSSEYVLLIVFFLFPMVCVFTWIAYSWARGRPIAPTELSEDERIFSEMHQRALRAQQVDGLDGYRCPACTESFELSNATPVSDTVVLCPFCGSRLIVG